MCERVFLYLFVANKSMRLQEAPYVEEGSVLNIDLALVSSDGSRKRDHGVSHPLRRQPIVLMPGDTIVFPIPLDGSFGTSGRHDDLPVCILPGEYTVELTYDKIYHVTPLKLKVVEATADDSLKIAALNTLMHKRRTPEEGVLLYDALYEKFRGSPLQLTVATFFIGEILAQPEIPHSNSIFLKKILRDHPTSGRVRQAVAVLCNRFGEAELRSAISQTPALLGEPLSRYQIRTALHAIGREDLYREFVK